MGVSSQLPFTADEGLSRFIPIQGPRETWLETRIGYQYQMVQKMLTKLLFCQSEKGQKRRLYDFDLFVATTTPLTTLIKRWKNNRSTPGMLNVRWKQLQVDFFANPLQMRFDFHHDEQRHTCGTFQYPMSMTQEVRGQPPKLDFLRFPNSSCFFV